MYIEESFNMTIQYGGKNIFSLMIPSKSNSNELDTLDLEWMKLITFEKNDIIQKSTCFSLKTNIFIQFTMDQKHKMLHKIYIVGNRDEIYQACGISLLQ
jgi:hypothetical protein